MSGQISGYNATQPPAPIKGTTGTGTITDKASSGDAAVAATSGSQSSDHLTLTDSARTLQKVGEAIAKAPIVNTAKVATVKQALSSGTYQIDAGRIADGLIRFERGLKQQP